MRSLAVAALLGLLAIGALAAGASEFEDGSGPARATPKREAARPPSGVEARSWPRPRYRDSVAIGTPSSGRLVRGVRLPPEGAHFFTWDPIRKTRPNRHWRRFGTDELVRTTLRIAREFGRAHASAPRVAIGDLSRTRGGDFGPQFGALGHASHQNGLDVDVYYPRTDGAERAPETVAQVDRRLAQDLVDRFVAAGAEKVFVGPSLDLRGPADVVVPLVHHDDHLHARFGF